MFDPAEYRIRRRRRNLPKPSRWADLYRDFGRWGFIASVMVCHVALVISVIVRVVGFDGMSYGMATFGLAAMLIALFGTPILAVAAAARVRDEEHRPTLIARNTLFAQTGPTLMLIGACILWVLFTQ